MLILKVPDILPSHPMLVTSFHGICFLFQSL